MNKKKAGGGGGRKAKRKEDEYDDADIESHQEQPYHDIHAPKMEIGDDEEDGEYAIQDNYDESRSQEELPNLDDENFGADTPPVQDKVLKKHKEHKSHKSHKRDKGDKKDKKKSKYDGPDDDVGISHKRRKRQK